MKLLTWPVSCLSAAYDLSCAIQTEEYNGTIDFKINQAKYGQLMAIRLLSFV